MQTIKIKELAVVQDVELLNLRATKIEALIETASVSFKQIDQFDCIFLVDFEHDLAGTPFKFSLRCVDFHDSIVVLAVLAQVVEQFLVHELGQADLSCVLAL